MSDLVMAWVEEYSRQPTAAARALRAMRNGNDKLFVEAALRVLRDAPDSPGAAHLLRVVSSDDRTLAHFADPAFLAAPEAVKLAARMQALDPSTAARLVRLLLPDSGPQALDPWQATRVLEIVEAITDPMRIQALLPSLLRHTDPRVRSKAALLMGRTSHSLEWVEQRLAERDPRVRANAVQSLWGVDSRTARELFQQAADDANHRVVANGLIGLHRAGELGAARSVERMAAVSDAWFRAAAVWAMGESGDPRFLRSLEQLIGARESGVVHQNAIRSTVRIRKRIAELQQLGPLGVSATWREGRLDVQVRRPNGEHLASLPSTAFVVVRDGHPLDISSVRACGLADGSSVSGYEVSLADSSTPDVRVCVYARNGMGEADAVHPGPAGQADLPHRP